MNKPKLILICGCSGSGKTTISELISKKISTKHKAAIICIDSYYTKKELIPVIDGVINYDHPDSFDWDLLKKDIDSILNNKPTKIRIYDYANHCYDDNYFLIENVDVIIFEGIYALKNSYLNSIADLKIFIETELDECLARRISRDVTNRGRTIDSVLESWRNVVKPMFKNYVLKLKHEADIIVPWKIINKKPVEIINNGIKGMFNVE